MVNEYNDNIHSFRIRIQDPISTLVIRLHLVEMKSNLSWIFSSTYIEIPQKYSMTCNQILELNIYLSLVTQVQDITIRFLYHVWQHVIRGNIDKDSI